MAAPYRDALEQLVSGHDLDADMAEAVMDWVMAGEASPAQVGALLAALRLKGESVSELTGMVRSLRAHAIAVPLEVAAVDTCGTGGDNLDTFNISTAAALVVAGAGCPVAKHGNRSASSRCGSADVLEALGVAVSMAPDGVRHCIEAAGIGFMYAPAFHPAMRHVATARRELGIRTVFNVLGPLSSPAAVPYQVIGISDRAQGPRLAEVFRNLGVRRAMVVAGHRGLDEIGLDGPAQVWDVTPAGVAASTIDAAQLGLESADVSMLRGGDPQTNARIIHEILAGADGPRRDVVVLNAAAALVAAGHATDVADGLILASRAIDTGAAGRCLEQWIRVAAEVAA